MQEFHNWVNRVDLEPLLAEVGSVRMLVVIKHPVRSVAVLEKCLKEKGHEPVGNKKN